MKLALVILGLLAVAAASVLPQNANRRVADKQFLQTQKAFLELVWRVNQPVYNQKILEIGTNYNIQANLEKYNNVEAVKQFYTTYKNGMLPRNQIFSVFYGKHLNEAIQLYQVFYSANDLDTLYKTACWARVHVNSGQFVYALQVAILHRQDTQGLTLPPPYEIYPHLYLDTQVIQQAYNARMQYNSQNQQQQQQQQTVVIQVNNTNLYPYYLYQGEQQQQQQQQQQGQQQQYNTYQYGGDYNQQVNPEARLTYFTEDIGVNAYNAFYHAANAFWLSQNNGYKNQHRGERFYYTLQQLLARYQLERYSNDLQQIGVFQWNQPIRTGYAPNLQYPNGQALPVRQDNIIPTKTGTYGIEYVQQLERRILDAIDLGYVLTQDGRKVSLYENNGIEILGNLVQNTADSVNPRYFGKLFQMTSRILGYISDSQHQHGVAPGVLAHYSTALRDPLYYRVINRIYTILSQYKKNLPVYQRQQLMYPGVRIQSIDVEKLITYFEQYDIDITGAALVNQVQDDKNLQIVARQIRLNNKPFNYRINVESDKTADVIVRVFLGPKYDSQGHVLNLNQKRQQMVEIDRFQAQLTTGTNTIQRNSRESVYTTGDFTTMRQLYQQVLGALQGQNQFYIDDQQNQCGFPQRLLLPKGKKGGMPYTLFVTINPLTQKNVEQQEQQQQQTIICGNSNIQIVQDQHALGYPFDRVIEETQFSVPNFYEKEVIIFHKRQEDMNNQSI